VRINSVGNSVFSSTDVVNGEVYYYRIKAEDIDGNESRGSMIVDTTEKINIIAVADDDPRNQIKMSKEINPILYKGNVYDEDINIVLERDDEEEKDGDTITCYDIKAMEADSGKEIKDFVFARPLANIVLAYEVENGHIKRVSSIPEDRASEQLALFWFNGLEWIKFGGEVDEDLHLASIRSKRIGKYRIKKSLRATSFVIEGIHPDKIFTPNGDGWNDYIEIQYANPKDGIVSGKIYDLRGALVAGMEKGGNDDTLKWDGKDTNSNPVPGGVYIYQIQVTGPENKVINGTVVVAR
jgi:gliding motility-associated-like protein